MCHDAKDIFPEDSEAAIYMDSVPFSKGWVDRNGRYWGDDERMARYSGATKLRCDDCGNPIPKVGYSCCFDCRALRSRKAFDTLPVEKWDGICMLYSETQEEYYTDIASALDFLKSKEDWYSLQLTLTRKVEISPLTSDDWYEEFPDGDVPQELEAIIEDFNIKLAKIDWNLWEPIAVAVDLEEYKEYISSMEPYPESLSSL